MNTESLLAGFKSIENELKNDEILALKKFTVLTGTEYLVESFFQELINCKVNNKPFYSSDNWKSLTKTEKKILGTKIREWHKRLLLFYPDYQKRCTYTSEDDLKLKIVFDGEDLGSKDEYNEFIHYLENIKTEKITEEGSGGFIKWLDKKIVCAKTQCEMNFANTNYNDQKKSLSDNNKEDFIFPNGIIDILTLYHKEFNGRIFEELRLDEFLKLFKKPGECNIIFKKELKGHFKYSISHIERYHTLDSDFNKWFSKKIGGSYKNSKREPIKNSDITEKIKSFFHHQIKQYELKYGVRP